MSVQGGPPGAALGQALLQAAREAVAARLAGRDWHAPREPVELRQPRGVFVTLRRRGDGALRGCIGLIEARLPLGEAVGEAARGAAFRDPRFDPVAPAELDALRVEVSVLSPLSPLGAEQVRVGTHGLLLRCAGRSGLLLPQVPLEQGWTRDEFLDGLCRKAGLPAGAWRRSDACLEGFTAEVFEEAP